MHGIAAVVFFRRVGTPSIKGKVALSIFGTPGLPYKHSTKHIYAAHTGPQGALNSEHHLTRRARPTRAFPDALQAPLSRSRRSCLFQRSCSTPGELPQAPTSDHLHPRGYIRLWLIWRIRLIYQAISGHIRPYQLLIYQAISGHIRPYQADISGHISLSGSYAISVKV